jgi:hypothetical protein
MDLNSKLLQAFLRDVRLRKELLLYGDLPEADYKYYDLLVQETRDIAWGDVVDVLEGCAPFQITYPSPVDQYPDDAKVYGTKGVYMVKTQEGIEFFSTKRAALELANSVSKVSWKVAKEMGYVD